MEGISIIAVKMFNDIVRQLKNVKYVPSLTSNLISLGVLDDSAYINKIEASTMKVCKGSMVVITVVKKR